MEVRNRLPARTWVTRERRAMADWFLYMTVIGGILTAVSDYRAGNLLVAWVGAIIAALSLGLIRLSRAGRFTSLPLVFTLGMLLAMYLVAGITQFPFHREKLAWAPLYPVAYFFLAGLAGGLVLSGFSFVLAIAGFFLAPLLMGQPAQTTGYEFSQGMGAFVTCAAFAFYYERIRTRQAEQLENSASHDALTGLLNRRGFAPMAEATLEQARRFGLPFAVVLIDIDDFKQVNDRHGHAMGDRLLAELGTLLTRQSRKADLLARWGGEEFILLLLRSTSESALAAAEKMRAAIADQAFAHGRTSASFGVAMHAPDETLDAAISRADRALYQAKRLGKNRVEFDNAA